MMLICWEEAYILQEKKRLVVASMEIGLEVNADTTKYMVMCLGHKRGRSHNMKIYNSFFEGLEELKYLVTALKIQNSVQEEIQNGLKSGNACYHSVQNFLSSSLLSKNLLFCMDVKLGR
jgi:hypothetical protein